MYQSPTIISLPIGKITKVRFSIVTSAFMTQ